jgi:hypothetical protein
MAEDEQDKLSAKNNSYIDSAELFENLFRKELDTLRAGEKGKPGLKKETKTGTVTKPRSSSQVKGARRRKPEFRRPLEKERSWRDRSHGQSLCS